MNDRDWSILATIARERNISRAAERLFISQPALSVRLRAIETEFNARIFLRTPKGVSLTPEGEQLVAYANDMLLALAWAKERVASLGGKVAGPLRIGSSSVFATYALPAVLRGFGRRYPEVELSLRTGVSREVLKLFEREEITVAIVRGDHPWSEVKHLLCEEPLCLVSGRPLELDELPDIPRIGYGSDPSLLEVLDSWWSEHYSRPPRTGIVVDSVEACRRMISHGLGYAILPTIGIDQLDQQRPVHRRALSWSDGDPVLRRTWLLSREASLDLPSVRAFVEHVLEATAPGARCAGG